MIDSGSGYRYNAYMSSMPAQSPLVRWVGLLGAPLAAILILLFCDLQPGQPAVTRTLAVAVLMAGWWVTEVIPLAATSLLPVVLFPLLGVLDGKTVSASYFNHVIFLFIGGFMVALAMERWNLHQRIALKILMTIGVSPARILLGFMLATAILSMWISNTATVMMMLPIAMAVIRRLEEMAGGSRTSRYSIGLLLGIAYSASVGGIATLVGTPPNLVFVRILNISFPRAPEISFAAWFIFALPLSVLFFTVVWGFLYWRFRPGDEGFVQMDSAVFSEQYKELGPMSGEEKVVLLDFTLLAVLWLTRSDISLGPISLTGWAHLFPAAEYINDGTVAVALALVLFIIPSRSERGRTVMDWRTANKLPWNIVLLFGGGFALAEGFAVSGLSLWLGRQLHVLEGWHPLLMIIIICLLVTFLTELTSNTATSQILLPVFGGLAVGMEVNPLLFMIPATISASMAFMLPVATPPNAIVFGTERLRIMDMVKTGLVLNLLGALLIALAVYFWGGLVFNLGLTGLPSWAGG
jgi:sodium-dependent dicarboxylate transporter 2/3/5